jgi:hypothetical protein
MKTMGGYHARAIMRRAGIIPACSASGSARATSRQAPCPEVTTTHLNGTLGYLPSWRPLVRHKAADRTCRKQVAGHATKDPLAKSAVPVSAGHK